MRPTQAISGGWRAAALAAALIALAGLGCDSSRNISRGISNLTNNGGLEVRSEPSRARIYVDNRYVGYTPMRLSLDRGSHLVELRKPGYKEAEVWRTVETGRSATLEVTLEAQ